MQSSVGEISRYTVDTDHFWHALQMVYITFCKTLFCFVDLLHAGTVNKVRRRTTSHCAQSFSPSRQLIYLLTLLSTCHVALGESDSNKVRTCNNSLFMFLSPLETGDWLDAIEDHERPHHRWIAFFQSLHFHCLKTLESFGCENVNTGDQFEGDRWLEASILIYQQINLAVVPHNRFCKMLVIVGKKKSSV